MAGPWEAFQSGAAAVQQQDGPWSAFQQPQEGGAAFEDRFAGEPLPKKKFGLGDTWPAKLAKAVYSGVTLPGDVVQGKVQLPSQEGLPGSIPPDAPGADDAIKRLVELSTVASPVSPSVRNWAFMSTPPLAEGAGRAVSAVAQPAVRTARAAANPEAEAARRVVAATQRDAQIGGGGLSPAEFAAAREGGAPVTVMDMGGETTRALARSAANTSPEGRAALGRTIDDRFEGQSERITGWLNRTFQYPNAQAQQEALDRLARTVNRPAYEAAYRQPAARSMWDEGFEQIAQAPVVQDAIRKASVTGANDAARQGFTPVRNPFAMDDTGRLVLRRNEDGSAAVPSLQFWDHVKRNLDKVGTREAQDWARVLRERLDELVPAYGQARAGAARFFGAGDALEAGQNFVRANLGSREARAALSRMSEEERRLFQDGFVSRFIETLNATGDRRNVLNQIAQSPAAREKLQIALGRERSNELEAVLRVEGVMDMARSAVQGNSTTARQLRELGLAGGTYTVGTGGSLLDPSGTALLATALVYGTVRGRSMIDERVARRVAEMLASDNPAVLQRGVRVIARNDRMMSALREFDRRIAVTGEGQLLGVQVPGVGRADSEQPSVPRPPGQ